MTYRELGNCLVADLVDYYKSEGQYKELSEEDLSRFAWREIEIYLKEQNGWEPADLAAKSNKRISDMREEKLMKFVRKRKKGKPLAQIIGKAYFYGHVFKVSRYTLIPRPETEVLVKVVLDYVKNAKPSNVLLADVGTGTGCIIISLLKNWTSATFPQYLYATDISANALEVARFNSKNILGRKKKIKFIRGFLINFLKKEKLPDDLQVVIAANLPYLTKDEWQQTSREVKCDPRQALIGGENGFELIKRLIEQIIELKDNVKRNKWRWDLFLEVSPTIAGPLLKARLFNDKLKIRKYADMNGKVRVIHLQF